jgi:phenylacetate-CoA ligase
VHPQLVNRVLFPLHERLKGKRTHARLRELEQTEWLSPEALRDLQFRRLKQHLEFAYREVPYYGRLLDAHQLPPSRVTSFEDFARIPCLTKDLIREHFSHLQPHRTKLRHAARVSTGGSTGRPVTVLVDRERMAFADAARLRAHRWFGADMGTREVVLWGSSLELTKQDTARTIRDRFINSRLLSAFDLGATSLARYARIIQRYRPGKLYGYASALYLLASYLRQIGWTPPGGWPRAIFTTAEPLFDFQRATIEAVFGCPVAVEYGCREVGLIAAECPAGGLHIAAEGVVLETLANGELVVTHVDSFAMPLIRYRTGDVGVLEPAPCTCGRGLPRLKSVEGRRTDFLITAGGRVMHALAVIYILREIPYVREFQVIQERLDRVTVKIVPGPGFSDADQAAVTSGIEHLFDHTVSVDVELADAIARPPSGKHRYVISDVADAYLETLLKLN